MKKLSVLFGLLGFLMSGYYATWQVSLLDRGFTLNHIAMLIAISVAVSIVFDVPSAMLADRMGHKNAVLLGFGTFAAGFLIPSVWHHPYSLAATVIMVAVGEAFIEGAIDAWTADLQRESQGSVTNHAFMGLDQIQRLGMILGAIIVPTVAARVAGASEGWLVYTVISAGIVLFAMSIPEGRATPHEAVHGTTALLELKGHFRSQTLLVMLAGAFLYGLGDGANQSAFWPRIKEIGVSNPTWLGIIQASMSLARVVGLQFWKRSKSVESTKLVGLSVAGSSLLYMLFATITHPVAALAVWFVRIMVLSAYFSALRGLTQKIYGQSRWKATIASALMTTSQLGVIALSSVLGLFRGTEAGTTMLLGGALSLAAGVMFLNVKAEADRQF